MISPSRFLVDNKSWQFTQKNFTESDLLRGRASAGRPGVEVDGPAGGALPEVVFFPAPENVGCPEGLGGGVGVADAAVRHGAP